MIGPITVSERPRKVIRAMVRIRRRDDLAIKSLPLQGGNRASAVAGLQDHADIGDRGVLQISGQLGE